MSNVRKDRHVEGDWWTQPIPENVEFGEGFYCESAQIFRKLVSKRPRAVVVGKHVSCYAGCSFSRGEDRDRIALPDFVECRHRRFRFSSARACPTSYRRAGSRAIFQKSSTASEVENSASKNRGQCLDRDERNHFERGEHRRELSCCRRIGGEQERTVEYSGCW